VSEAYKALPKKDIPSLDEAEENGFPAVELFSEWYRQNHFTGHDR
jgi:hypothetical protein